MNTIRSEDHVFGRCVADPNSNLEFVKNRQQKEYFSLSEGETLDSAGRE